MKYKDTELGHGRRTWEKGKEMEMGSEMEKSTDLGTRKEMEKELESDISFQSEDKLVIRDAETHQDC